MQKCACKRAVCAGSVCGVKVLEVTTLGARGSENPQESGRDLNEFI